MKHCFAVVAALSVCAVLAGCCAGKNCDKKCDKTEKRECIKKCVKNDFAGRWMIYIQKDGKLEGLAIDPQPEIELKSCGKMIFHYSKDGKPMTAEGIWTVNGNSIDLGSIENKSIQRKLIVINDKELEMVVGRGDALPEGTKLMLIKK